jgi:hypothetical protein
MNLNKPLKYKQNKPNQKLEQFQVVKIEIVKHLSKSLDHSMKHLYVENSEIEICNNNHQ